MLPANVNKKITIIISVFNEEEGVNSFYNSLIENLTPIKDYFFEIIWVNDGSTDKTKQILSSFCEKNIEKTINNVIIDFSKNYGHEAAMIAGIDSSSGDFIVCMDADGQHPASEINNILKSFEKGVEIVVMKRLDREDYGFIKSTLTGLFYFIINVLSVYKFEKGSSDFFAISKQVGQILRTNFREKNRFIRGFIQNIGFTKDVLPYNSPSRIYGESKYNYYKLLKHAVNAVFSFSNKPLRLSIIISLVFVGFTFLFGGYTLYMFLFGNTPPSGYTTIVLFMAFAFSLLFVVITIISIYFEKAIDEMKNRPIYIIKTKEMF